MKFKKIFTYIILTTYLFISAGFNNYAFSMCSCNGQCHRTKNITCPCCMHKAKLANKLSYNKSNQVENSCNCCKKQPLPTSGIIQSGINSSQYVAYMENIYKKTGSISDLIIFKDISYTKVHPNQILISNKNLEMLRTVILLT